jgi:hypothetical protein
VPDRREPADGHAPISRWRRLGRLLPNDVRERVFEPAYADLARAWVTSAPVGERASFGLRAVATWAGCIPIAAPRLFVRDGRLTRMGRVVVLGGAAVALLAVVVSNVVAGYGAYGSP